MKYIILAGGQGSRLANDGLDVPKPLVELSGEPMIGRLIRNLLPLEAEEIVIAVNEEMTAVTDYLYDLKNREKLPLTIRPIPSINSFYSLHRAVEGLEGKYIGLTVDTIFPPDEFAAYVKEVEEMKEGEVLMGLTGFIDDESPLYARIDDGGLITDYKYGGTPFDGDPMVSAGIYGLTSAVIDRILADGEPASLNELQQRLAYDGDVKVRPFRFSKALDVDHVSDVEKAESFLQSMEAHGGAPQSAKRQTLKEEYLASLKSSDTEENIDLGFYRPIGFLWACLFRKLRVTPNVVTVMSIFLGVGAGVLFYFNNLWINIVGMILLVWANSYDSADGQLARMTGQYSRLGRMLDGLAGDLWFTAIYVAIALRLSETGQFEDRKYLAWALVVAAGISHLIQASIADRLRQFHLFIVKNGKNSELESASALKSDFKAGRETFFGRISFYAYYVYTKIQEAFSPDLIPVVKKIKTEEEPGAASDTFGRFRTMSLPLCKWENFLTFNWRCIFLFVFLFLGRPGLFPLAELTLFNGVLIYLVVRHRVICSKMLDILDGQGKCE